VDRTYPGRDKGGGDAIRTRFGVIPREIVAHFRFYAGVRVHVKTNATAGSYKVGGVALIEAVILSKRSNFNVVLRLRDNPWHSDAEGQNSD
jgi:hypothetical protein